MALDPFDILPVIKGEDSGSWFCYGTSSVGLPSHSRQRDGALEACTLCVGMSAGVCHSGYQKSWPKAESWVEVQPFAPLAKKYAPS